MAERLDPDAVVCETTIRDSKVLLDGTPPRLMPTPSSPQAAPPPRSAGYAPPERTMVLLVRAA